MLQQNVGCGTCLFYMAGPRVCRRYPPVPLMVGLKQNIANIQQEPLVVAYFPAMSPTGWCGEYQPECPPDTEN